MVVCGLVVGLGMNLSGLGMNLMRSRGSSWVRWWWLVVGRRGWGGRGSPWVVLARCGSVGFDGLARLDSMVAGLASVVVGLV